MADILSEREYQKEWRTQNKERRRNIELKYKFGITLEDYNNLFAAQEGKCKICKKHQTELKTTLHVDHNHITGKVRGLLCKQCNFGIGYLQDNPELCRDAAKYLEE